MEGVKTTKENKKTPPSIPESIAQSISPHHRAYSEATSKAKIRKKDRRAWRKNIFLYFCLRKSHRPSFDKAIEPISKYIMDDYHAENTNE